ncbi:MAG: hypothetical protein J6R35_01035 [Clostridia bacterium]|nr:hypothetical protein [Clostridia bacterium]
MVVEPNHSGFIGSFFSYSINNVVTEVVVILGVEVEFNESAFIVKGGGNKLTEYFFIFFSGNLAFLIGNFGDFRK